MKIFDIKSPVGWELMLSSDKLAFDCPNGARTVAFTVNSTDQCTVWASFTEDMKDAVLVASCYGIFQCSLSTAIPVYVQFRSEMGAQMYVKGPAASHLVEKTDEEAYTNPIPQGRRNTELDRMMYMAKLNERRRDEMLAETLRQIREDAKPKPDPDSVIEDNPSSDEVPEKGKQEKAVKEKPDDQDVKE
ncbi:hypothetical protein [Roseobacter sp. MH60115]|uniref:hypothetical protein n=1 Tax=Roseobacter sp. MH60115 TaxID=2785324 RepID=UPI0018A2E85D|nr:hypothetical protein [Roseobacter sp. MH60115]